tara:strand:- start:1672 stop:1884 length:213 start_codon:yes stop_codon:yes gene_type:complete
MSDYKFFTPIGLATLILQSSALKIAQTKKHSSKLGVFLFVLFIRDPGRIQTYNRWSRNPVRYSVAPRGLL